MQDALPEPKPEGTPRTLAVDGGGMQSLGSLLQGMAQERRGRLDQLRPRLERFLRLNYAGLVERLEVSATVQDFVLAMEDLPEFQMICDFLGAEMETSGERVRRETRVELERQLDLDGAVLMEILPPVPDGLKSLVGFRPRKRFPDVAQAELATKEWMGATGPPLLTLSGPPGTGKTHLAQGAVVHLQETPGPYRLAYFTEGHLVQYFREGIRHNDVGRRMDAACRVDWLVVDDLGEQAKGDWDRGRVDELINVRWEEGLRTMFTTNLLGPDMPPRIASRLGDTERGVVVTIEALDYRIHGA